MPKNRGEEDSLHGSFLDVHVKGAQDGRSALADTVAFGSVAYVDGLERAARLGHLVMVVIEVQRRSGYTVHYLFRQPAKK